MMAALTALSICKVSIITLLVVTTLDGFSAAPVSPQSPASPFPQKLLVPVTEDALAAVFDQYSKQHTLNRTAVKVTASTEPLTLAKAVPTQVSESATPSVSKGCTASCHLEVDEHVDGGLLAACLVLLPADAENVSNYILVAEGGNSSFQCDTESIQTNTQVVTCSGLDVDAVGSPVRLHDTAVGIASGDFGSPLWKGRLILNDDITPRVQSLDVTAIVSSESPGLPISWHSLAYGTLRLLEETAAVVSTHTSLDRVPNNHYSLMTSRPLSYPINESSELWSISLRPWDQFQESYRLRTHRRRASGAAGAMVGTLRGITRKCDPNRHHVVLVFGLGEDMEGESSSILKEISSCKTTRIRVSVFAVGLEDLVNPAVRHINTYSDTDTLSLSSVVNFTEGSYASFISVAGNTSDRFRLQNGLVSDIFRRTHASQQYKPEHRCNLRATKPTSPASPDGLLTPGSSIFPKWHAGVKAAAVTASAVTPDQKSHTSTTVTRDLEADISIVTPGHPELAVVTDTVQPPSGSKLRTILLGLGLGLCIVCALASFAWTQRKYRQLHQNKYVTARVRASLPDASSSGNDTQVSRIAMTPVPVVSEDFKTASLDMHAECGETKAQRRTGTAPPGISFIHQLADSTGGKIDIDMFPRSSSQHSYSTLNHCDISPSCIVKPTVCVDDDNNADNFTDDDLFQLQTLMAAVHSDEASLFAERSSKLTDAAPMRWLAKSDTAGLHFQYCSNTITLANSNSRAYIAKCNGMVAVTMVTSTKVEPFLPGQIAPAVNIKFSGETIPCLVLSHELDIPVTDKTFTENALAVLKLAPSRRKWLVDKRILRQDISTDGYTCYGEIHGCGTYTVAMLPVDLDLNGISVPTRECADGKPGLSSSGGRVTNPTSESNEPSSVPRPYYSRRHRDDDDDDEDKDDTERCWWSSERRSTPRSAVFVAYTTTEREQGDDCIVVCYKIHLFRGRYRQDHPQIKRIHEVIRATGCMSVVEELPGSQAGLGHISLGEVEEGDEIKISFKDSCAGVEISEEAQSPKSIPLSECSEDQQPYSADLVLADPTVFLVRCKLSLEKLREGRPIPVPGRHALRFRVPATVVNCDQASHPTPESNMDDNNSILRVAVGTDSYQVSTLTLYPGSSQSSVAPYDSVSLSSGFGTHFTAAFDRQQRTLSGSFLSVEESSSHQSETPPTMLPQRRAMQGGSSSMESVFSTPPCLLPLPLQVMAAGCACRSDQAGLRRSHGQSSSEGGTSGYESEHDIIQSSSACASPNVLNIARDEHHGSQNTEGSSEPPHRDIP